MNLNWSHSLDKQFQVIPQECFHTTDLTTWMRVSSDAWFTFPWHLCKTVEGGTVDLCLQGKEWHFYPSYYFFFFFSVITIDIDCYIPINYLNIKLLRLVIIIVRVVATQNIQKILYMHIMSKEPLLKQW